MNEDKRRQEQHGGPNEGQGALSSTYESCESHPWLKLCRSNVDHPDRHGSGEPAIKAMGHGLVVDVEVICPDREKGL